MFSFQPTLFQILILIGGTLLAVAGLTAFALRRREEILEDYFTPDEKDIEDDFFRRRAERRAAAKPAPAEEDADSAQPETEEAQWGNAE